MELRIYMETCLIPDSLTSFHFLHKVSGQLIFSFNWKVQTDEEFFLYPVQQVLTSPDNRNDFPSVWSFRFREMQDW